MVHGQRPPKVRLGLRGSLHKPAMPRGAEWILLLRFAQRRLLKCHWYIFQVLRDYGCIHFGLRAQQCLFSRFWCCTPVYKASAKPVPSQLRGDFWKRSEQREASQMVKNPTCSLLDPFGSFPHRVSFCVSSFSSAMQWREFLNLPVPTACGLSDCWAEIIRAARSLHFCQDFPGI